MKRSVCVWLLIILTAALSPASAEPFYRPGDTVTVIFEVTENPQRAAGARIVLEYDHDALTLVGLDEDDFIEDSYLLVTTRRAGIKAGTTLQASFRVNADAAQGDYTVRPQVVEAFSLEGGAVTGLSLTSGAFRILTGLEPVGRVRFMRLEADAITLEWQAVPNAEWYRVSVESEDGLRWDVGQIEGTTVEITGLEPDTMYAIVLTAGAGQLESIPREIAAFTRAADRPAAAEKQTDPQPDYHYYTGFGQGFAGTVTVHAAFSPAGVIQELYVDENGFEETPGIGGRALDRENLRGFIGAQAPVNADDIDALAGATFTRRGIAEAVNQALEAAVAAGDVVTAPATPAPKPAAVTYTAEGRGLTGTFPVTVTVENGEVIAVEVGDASTEMDKPFLNTVKANMDFLAQFLGTKGNVNLEAIDTVTGATVSSRGVVDAVNEAWAAIQGMGQTGTFPVTAGSYVTFGTYPQTEAGDDQTPIEWMVLDVQGSKALLISRYGLDAKPYNTTRIDITWEECTLREWLNHDFLSRAFSDSEQEAILTTAVDNSKSQGNSGYNTNGGNNTNDKVFLLSYAEAWTYFGSNDDLKCAPTEFAIKRGAYTSPSEKANDRSSGWLLRSPGRYQRSAARVDSDGSRRSDYVNYADAVVRPALWVNLESDIF